MFELSIINASPVFTAITCNFVDFHSSSALSFRQGRFKRSNSVTAAVQADLELEGFPIMEDKGLQFGGGFQRHSEPSTPTQYGAVRTVRTQGLFSYRDDYRTTAEPSSPRETTSETSWQLEPPSPRESAASAGESGRVSPCLRRDGSWFMQLLHTETKRMEAWCKEMEAEAEENDLSEERKHSMLYMSSMNQGSSVDCNCNENIPHCVSSSVLGKIRSAVGSAQLLMSQKFQQFYWLCQQNLVRQGYVLEMSTIYTKLCMLFFQMRSILKSMIII